MENRKLFKSRLFGEPYNNITSCREAFNFFVQSEGTKEMENRKYTNQYLRQLLGERGFIQYGPNIKGRRGWVHSLWIRGAVKVDLHETSNDLYTPYLTLNNGKIIKNPEEELGYRNTNVQNDGSSDE